MQRRTVLKSAGLSVGLVGGCTGNRSRTDPSTAPESPTETSASQAFLPPSGDGWTLAGTSDYEWAPLGGDDGVIGRYEGPDGQAYEMVVMHDEDNAEGSARQFACAGWQLAFPYEGFAVAASSGTYQRTFTPEAPPTMSSAPVDDRLNRVRELLVRSSELTDATVPDETECPYNTET